MNNPPGFALRETGPDSPADTEKNGRRRERKIKNAVLFPAVCFFAAFLLIALVFLTEGISLFGGKSILISDMRQQYVHFFSALRNGDWFYSDGLSLSGGFFGSFAYYLSSPFSAIVFLFPLERIQTALLLIIFLKAAAACSAFACMIRRLYHRAGSSALLFSLCYALMSFVFFFFINLFWLDALIWLPVLAVLTEKLVKTGRSRMLPPALAALFISNFYISYITGLFLALLFFYFSAASALPVKTALKRSARLLSSALLAAGMAAAVLLPALGSFARSFGAESFNGYGVLNFTPRQLLLKLFAGSFDSIGNFAAPTVYCGMLIFLLALCFFFMKAIPRREKIASALILAVFFLSFLLPQLDIVWHAFSFPNAFAYRYAFCFCFFIITLAMRAFFFVRGEHPAGYGREGDFPGTNARFPLPILLLSAAAGLGTLLFYRRLLSALPAASVLLTAGCLILYPTLLFLLGRDDKKLPARRRVLSPDRIQRVLSLLLPALVAAELFLNGSLILGGVGRQNTFPDYDLFTKAAAAKRALLETAGDRGGFRVADTEEYSLNEGASLGYNGVSGFSSDFDPKLQRLFLRLGYGGEFKSCGYLPGSAVTDSFFGVKYILADRELPYGYLRPVASEQGRILYQNDSALPAAFCADPSVRGFTLSEDPEENRRTLLHAILLSDHSDASDSAVLREISAVSLQIEHWGGGRITGRITAPADCILQTTLPFDPAWRVTVDGRPAPAYETLGALLASDISAGTHRVEIRYRPMLFWVGSAVSALSVAGWLLYPKIKKKPAGDRT